MNSCVAKLAERLTGKTLTIGTHPVSSYFKKAVTGPVGQKAIRYQGALFYFLDAWKDVANISYRVIECSDHEHCKIGHPLGQQDANGTWGGLISFLVRGQADIVAYDWVYVTNRDEAADYLYPWFDTGLSILVPIDEEAEIKHRLSLDQFGFRKFWRSWLAMLAYMLILYAIGLFAVAVGALSADQVDNLNLRFCDIFCLINYRKFIAQSKTPIAKLLSLMS